MPNLDQRGDISVAIIIVYAVVFVLSLILTFRHGFSKQAGWVHLLLFSIFRIVGGILHVAAEKTVPPKTGLYIGAFALESAGLAPLLLTTLSFLGVAAGTATTLRRVGVIILLASFIILGFFDLLFWQAKGQLMKYQKTLLNGISCGMPFLAVRVVYSVLSSFSGSSTFSASGISSTSSSSLAKFNSISGSWELFLVMSTLMEFVVVAIYIFFGLRLPISKGAEYQGTDTESPSVNHVPLYPQPAYYPPPQVQTYTKGGYR
ncbi:hypothetical protein DFH11DRAFT_1560345 [Phellopilus nigrolimitatus]|nr:hypothetical protein DFH11DRAFT_1560345 [Phellopilus nigrolimitatus]